MERSERLSLTPAPQKGEGQERRKSQWRARDVHLKNPDVEKKVRWAKLDLRQLRRPGECRVHFCTWGEINNSRIFGFSMVDYGKKSNSVL